MPSRKVNTILLGWMLTLVGAYWSIQLYQITDSVNRVRREMTIKVSTFPEVLNTTTYTLPTEVTTPVPNRILLEPWKITLGVCDEDNCIKSKNTSWRMVIFVKSSAPNFFRRELLRRTWASLSYVNGGRFDTVFVVANTDVPRLKLLVQEEHSRYGDILHIDASDAYKDVVIKTLVGMKWASSNLDDDVFYASADDDFIIKMDLFAKNINDNLKQMSKEGWPEFPIICGFKRGANEGPVRKGKWFVSKEIYRWTSYPPYCHGGLYATSVRLVKQLYNESLLVPSISLDDVWITGLLRRRLGMPDEMVVKPPAYFGLHQNGYAKSESKNIRGFLKDEWSKIYKQITTNDYCHCQFSMEKPTSHSRK
uniref:Hexosyltransferase n=1 Tax=Ciona savignyi TaxID=51511 RepID=H2Y8Z0_CIOSA